MTAQVVQSLSGHAWLALLAAVLWPLLLWVRTRVNITRTRAWDRASQDIGVSEDERRKLFANAMRRDLQLRDSPYRRWQAHRQRTKRLRRQNARQ